MSINAEQKRLKYTNGLSNKKVDIVFVWHKNGQLVYMQTY
jgi:hypothetical protein